MKKIMIASLGLSLLSGTAVFAQDTTATKDTMSSGTMKSKTKHKKNKKGEKGETSSTTASTSTSK
jgi:hypothetical protein